MFYKILQEIMDSKKLKIADVARATGLSDSTIRSIITRKSKTVALEVAFKISKGLDVSLEKLNGICEDAAVIQNEQIKNTTVEINRYNKLNKLGKQKVDEYIKDLLDNPKYTTKDKSISNTDNFELATDITHMVLDKVKNGKI